MDLNTTMYHIYPLGFCDAPKENDGKLTHRMMKIQKWIPHLEKLGVTSLYLGPIFESDRHGYDIRDYNQIDVRLGDEKDVKKLCDALHKKKIQVLFDGVFNHVGRGFFAFQDVLEKKWDSPYKDWFYIDFSQSQNENGFTYANWEGHSELVKLNLDNEDVVQYLFHVISHWMDTYHIDGLRLDVAYCLNQSFLWKLHHFVKEKDPNFFLLGEMIGGDYNLLLKDGLLDSVTNYECRKGLYSSMNAKNLFEIGYSLNRQFGKEPWCLYTNQKLLSFIDNHDVDRIASLLEDKQDLPLLYALLFAMPGIPCLYYGSEWGQEGMRTPHSDEALRPSFSKPKWNDLTSYLASLISLRKQNPVFLNGDYQQIYIQNQQLIFKRSYENTNLLFAVNIDYTPHTAHFDLYIEKATNLLTGKSQCISHELELPAKSALFFVY